ncbi:hypothetical protein [Streptomyces malaysiensis]
MSHYVSITCDVEDSGLGAPKTATEARQRIRSSGWHRTRDGRDICPNCWNEGRR